MSRFSITCPSVCDVTGPLGLSEIVVGRPSLPPSLGCAAIGVSGASSRPQRVVEAAPAGRRTDRDGSCTVS